MPLPSTFEIESPYWLRNIRWAAIAGIAVLVAFARILGTQFPSSPIFVVLGLLGLWNLLLPWIEHRFQASAKELLFLQLVTDLLLALLVRRVSGPFAACTFFHSGSARNSRGSATSCW